MLGYKFTEYRAPEDNRTPFEKLFELFKELLYYTSGDVDEALEWMRQLDEAYDLSEEDYTLDDFIEDLKERSYVEQKPQSEEGLELSAKTEQLLRQQAMEQIFTNLKKSNRGNHKTSYIGQGEEPTGETRPYQYGDKPENIDMTHSLRNAQINHGIDNFRMTEEDLAVNENHYKTQASTVLMIDVSHSMILYGEDRITPAKKVAMGLAELINTKYPKDTLDILAFGNDAWEIKIKDLPYLEVGPYHTNTVAGLKLAMNLLSRKRNENKQIFMITDGKPTCLKLRDGSYYKNSMGFDPKIENKTLNLARQCRKLDIDITTFMVTRNPYLMKFVEEFTEANNGKAFYASLDRLGEFIFEDYERNKRKRY